MELYQAIVKMEQDGSADGVLQVCLNKCGPTRVFWELSWVHLQLQFQVRADRIQTDLDELVKAVNERCKKYGLRAKPITLTELPFGKFLSCFPMFFIPFTQLGSLQSTSTFLALLCGIHMTFYQVFLFHFLGMKSIC